MVIQILNKPAYICIEEDITYNKNTQTVLIKSWCHSFALNRESYSYVLINLLYCYNGKIYDILHNTIHLKCTEDVDNVFVETQHEIYKV